MTRFACLAALVLAGPAAAQPKVPAELEKPLELFRAGKGDECLEALKKAVAANPALSPPRVILADWFLQAGQGPNARLNIERGAVEDPKHPEIYLKNASFAFGEGRITDAVLNLQLAQQLAADARWTAEQKKKFLHESRMGLAACHQNRGDATATRDVLTAVLADDPKNGPARQQLAGALFALGKPDDAFTEQWKAYGDDPAVEIPELRMAVLCAGKANETAKLDEAKGHRDTAERWMQQGIKMHPKSARPARAYASWLLDDGRAEAAAPYLDAAAKIDPTGRETLALRGLWHRHKKDFAAAETVFEQLYKDTPNDPFTASNLALALAESGKDDKQKRAINVASGVAQQNPNSGDALATLGWCKYKAGRMDEAERDLTTAPKAGRLTLDSVYFVSRLLADRKKVEEAHNLLKAALDARGPFVYRPDAAALLAEVAKQLPPPKK